MHAVPAPYRRLPQLPDTPRTMNDVAALRALVEKVTIDRQQAALKAREDLQALPESHAGKPGPRPGQTERRAAPTVYRQQLRQIKVWLARQPNLKTLFIGHRDTIQDPLAVAGRLNVFLGSDLDVAAMAGVVDGSLYRQRAVAAAIG